MLVLVLVLVLVVVRTTAAPAQPLGAPAPRSDDLIVVLRHPDKPTGVRQSHLVKVRVRVRVRVSVRVRIRVRGRVRGRVGLGATW